VEEALEWAACDRFSPLHKGMRINPYWGFFDYLSLKLSKLSKLPNLTINNSV
jgi:hypothetical protein